MCVLRLTVEAKGTCQVRGDCQWAWAGLHGYVGRIPTLFRAAQCGFPSFQGCASAIKVFLQVLSCGSCFWFHVQGNGVCPGLGLDLHVCQL